PWRNRFDIVFSNAVFHWIPDQETLLNAVYRVLKPQGKLVCEFGARFNILRIREAFRTALERRGLPYTTRFYFPSAEEYGSVLEQAGFRLETMKEFDRPTPLKDGPDGLRNWANQFFREDLKNLHEEQRIQIFKEMENSLKDELWDGSQWVADYRRIRVTAAR
ncbi:methyltransferase domain-containing protein, partial [uncultured Akkermansia sp.]